MTWQRALQKPLAPNARGEMRRPRTSTLRFNLGLDSSCVAPIWSACASDDQLYFVHCELG
jgi:hypothetical protein